MRVGGSKQRATRRRIRAVDAQQQVAAASVAGSNGPAPVHSVPTLDALAAAGSEGSHVHGGAAASATGIRRAFALEAEPLAISAVPHVPMALPVANDMLRGSETAGPPIDLLATTDNAAALASLRAGIASSPTPSGFLDPAWLAARASSAAAAPPDLVTWSDPASVEGAEVLTIGPATVVLSNWPEASAVTTGRRPG